MAKPFLSVIIPAYNEADRLPITLIDVDKHLSQQEYSYEIIVVNDGSKDQTAEIVNRFAGLVNNLRLINNPDNRGKGAVVRQGMLAAKGNWRVFMDADNSTSVSEFNKMLPYLKEGYEIVIGSRAARGAKLQPPQKIHRQIIGKLGNLFIQLILLRGIWDSQCGFKCFSEEAANWIFSKMKINRWGFDVESLALARAMGYRIKELPIVWSNDFRSHVTTKAYFQVFWDTIKVRWWLKKKAYQI